MPRSLFGKLFPRAKPVALPAKPVAIPQPMTLGRAEAPTGERTDKAVPHEGVSAFLFGTFTYVTSSWLRSAKYHMRSRELEVAFDDGFSCRVQDISEAEARGFFDAPSKGGFYHDHILGPYYKRGHPETALKRWV